MIDQSRGKLVVPARQVMGRPSKPLVRPVSAITQQTPQPLAVQQNSLPAKEPDKSIQEVKPNPTALPVVKPTKPLPTIPVIQTVAVSPVQPRPLPPAKRVVDSLVLPAKKELLESQPKDIIPTPTITTNKSSQVISDKDKNIRTVDALNQESVVKNQPKKKSQTTPKLKIKTKGKKKGYRFFKSKASLGVSILVIIGLSGAIGYATWQTAGVFIDDNDSLSSDSGGSVLGARDRQDHKPEVLEVDSSVLRVARQSDLDFTKDRITKPDEALFSQGVFLVDYEQVIVNLHDNSRFITKSNNDQQEYRYKDIWRIDSLETVASILPAKKEIMLVGYDQTNSIWSIAVLEKIYN